jgi:hypothetical protein
MKAYWEVEVWFHACLTSAIGGGAWSASQTDRFTPMERAYHLDWRLGGPQIRSGHGGEEKISHHLP